MNTNIDHVPPDPPCWNDWFAENQDSLSKDVEINMKEALYRAWFAGFERGTNEMIKGISDK